MALVDRAIVGADVLVMHAASMADLTSGAAITSTGAQVDPIVSGTNFAHLFDGAAASKTITIPTRNLTEYDEACIEFYLYMNGSSTFVATKLGADNLIEFVSTGLAKINLPYATATSILVDFTPDDTTQFSINLTQGSYTVFVDGVQIATGSAPSGGFKSLSNLTMTSPSSGTLVFGACAVYPKAQEESAIQARQVEAVFCTPDAGAWFDFVNYEISDLSQHYSTKYDIPKSYPWSDYLVDGLTTQDGNLQLDLTQVEEYDANANAWVTNRAYYMWGTNTGQANVQIPSYSATGTNRGILHMLSRVPGADQFALRFNTGNRVELLRTTFSVDANGVDTSTVVGTVQATPGVAITGGATVNVGFGWDTNGLYVVYGSTAMLVPNTAGLNFGQYEVVFGTTRSSVQGPFDQPYFSSQGAWTWELRLWSTFNSASPAVSASNYGNHTFFTAEYTKPVPVRAEASVVVDVPLQPGDSVRVPWLYIDGELTGVTETLV
jgi:hypothetical protein